MHPDASAFIRLRDRRLPADEAEAIRAHLERCAECARVMQGIERFMVDLDEAWKENRLAETATRSHWPTHEDLIDYYLDDLPSAQAREAIAQHVRDCAGCRDVLEDLEHGVAELERADPLGRPGSVPAVAGHGWHDTLSAWMRFSAWPAWSLAAAAVVGVFALGLLLRPVLWPANQRPVFRLPAQLEKPALERLSDGGGGPVLGLGGTMAKPEARALLEKALAFHDLPDFPQRALPVLEQAVAIDPSYEQARFWLGVCYLLQANESAALPQLEAAVRLAPGNRTYQQYLIWGYLRVGEYQKALEAQTRLLNRK